MVDTPGEVNTPPPDPGTGDVKGTGTPGSAADVVAVIDDDTIMKSLTPAQKAMFEYLEEVNGQDFYNATDAALGKLDKSKYLHLPLGFVIPDVAVEDVGDPVNIMKISFLDQARIYAMNKKAFPDDATSAKGAILRVYMVAAGWLLPGATYEVTYETPPADSLETFVKDWDLIKDVITRAKKLAYLLPIVCEHVFRTMGHHYLTGQGADFERKYRRAFDACVEPDLHTYLPPAELYHTAGHWVSLSRALAVSTNPDQALRLPNALVIRSRAAPAGTAIITTSVAILNALAGTGMKEAYLNAAGIDETILTTMTQRVTSNPGAFHTIPGAYGKKALAPEERLKLEGAKELASSMAPILQGFVDSLPRDCDLAMAKALAKHANLNPTLRKQAKTFFSAVARTKVGDIRQLISAAIRPVTYPAADALALVGDED
jgi:hypothetical protein